MPHSYKQNVCHYKDQFRYFYSAMVSALDHSVDQVGSYCWFESMTVGSFMSKMRKKVGFVPWWIKKARCCYFVGESRMFSRVCHIRL